MTLGESIQLLQDEIKKRKKLSVGNVLDKAFNIGQQQIDELQKKLNELLAKKDLFTDQDAAEVQALIDEQAQDAKERNKIRLKKIIFTASVFLGTGVAIWFELKRKKK